MTTRYVIAVGNSRARVRCREGPGRVEDVLVGTSHHHEEDETDQHHRRIPGVRVGDGGEQQNANPDVEEMLGQRDLTPPEMEQVIPDRVIQERQ